MNKTTNRRNMKTSRLLPKQIASRIMKTEVTWKTACTGLVAAMIMQHLFVTYGEQLPIHIRASLLLPHIVGYWIEHFFVRSVSLWLACSHNDKAENKID